MKVFSCLSMFLASAAVVQGFTKGGSGGNSDGGSNGMATPGWILDFASGGASAGKPGSTPATVYPANTLSGGSPQIYGQPNQLNGGSALVSRPTGLIAPTGAGGHPSSFTGMGGPVSNGLVPGSLYSGPGMSSSHTLAGEVVVHHVLYPPSGAMSGMGGGMGLGGLWGPGDAGSFGPWGPGGLAGPGGLGGPGWGPLMGPARGMGNAPASLGSALSGLNADLLAYLIQCLKHNSALNGDGSAPGIGSWSPAPVVTPGQSSMPVATSAYVSRPQHSMQPQQFIVAARPQQGPQHINQMQQLPQQQTSAPSALSTQQQQQRQQQPQQSQQQQQQQQQANQGGSSQGGNTMPMLSGGGQQQQRGGGGPSSGPGNNRLPGMPSLLEINQQLQSVGGQKTG